MPESNMDRDSSKPNSDRESENGGESHITADSLSSTDSPKSPVSPDSHGEASSNREWSRPLEHFIPVGMTDLEELLPEYRNLSEEDQVSFKKVCEMVNALIHFRYNRNLVHLMRVYAPLDPDSAVVRTKEITHAQRDEFTDQLFDNLTSTLERANYRRLNRDEIELAISAASQLGVRLTVNFDVFYRLEVFVRGDGQEKWNKRNWRTLFRKKEIDVDIFRRLVVAFRLKEHKGMRKTETADSVYIKTFKNIPHTDLAVLLPGTRIRMTPFDHGKIWVPTISGILVNIWKAGRALMLVTVFASIFAFLKWIGLIVAVGLYVAKIVFGHIQTQDKYLLSLTQHLYFQNLDNNKGGLYRILNEAEDQEYRETVIAYFMLWTSKTALSVEELDRQCESFLLESLNVQVDFEIADSVRKLSDFGIAKKDEAGNWTALPPSEALRIMDYKWDNEFPYNNQLDNLQPKLPG